MKENGIDTTLARRRVLNVLGGAGAALVVTGSGVPAVAQNTFQCLAASAMTEGPYWVEEKLNRSDIRSDTSTGAVSSGVPLSLAVTVHAVSGSTCSRLPGAFVDIWQCDATGLYSDVAQNNTVGRKFLRGYQVTDGQGVARFTTIYPGWYRGRTVHIHVRIRTYSGTQVLSQFVTQLFFDDAVNDAVLSQAPYNTRGTRDTRNSNDMVYLQAANASRTLVPLTQTASGYTGAIDIAANLQAGSVVTTSFALPQLAYGGGWYTALYFTNTTDAETSIQVNFVGENGTPLTVPVTGMGSASSHTIDIEPRATVVLEMPNNGALVQGWAEAALPAGVVGYGVFRQSSDGRSDQEAVIPLSPQTSQAADLVYDDVNFTTSVALANPSSQQVTVTIAVYGSDGTQIGSSPVTLAPRSKTAVVLRNLPGLAAVAGKRGWAAFSVANGAVAALGLRFGGQAFTSIPVSHK